MLSYADPLPARPERVLVAGVSGVGKTTLAARIAEITGGAHTEIDGLFHGPGWTPRGAFLDDVRALVAAPAWTTEWQYGIARPILAGRADLLVWLDLPFYRVTLPGVVRRTLRRRLRREELWNGNVEGPLRHFFTDPEHIVRWAYRTRNKYAELVPSLARTHPRLAVVRLRSRGEVDTWVTGPLSRACCRTPGPDVTDPADPTS
ncbi:AAA family ATPase [Nocardia higoensis]|uniref:AAA family ATPase n=1 Tax=Nocardia higoensis TaxID=228599 RepID=A0ABS0DG65_9NOCA|nr:AAA family ATPase [Nocardia higoensis]MBF6357462.1 AAA family ATPase [Nocardia higoensis]